MYSYVPNTQNKTISQIKSNGEETTVSHICFGMSCGSMLCNVLCVEFDMSHEHFLILFCVSNFEFVYCAVVETRRSECGALG